MAGFPGRLHHALAEGRRRAGTQTTPHAGCQAQNLLPPTAAFSPALASIPVFIDSPSCHPAGVRKRTKILALVACTLCVVLGLVTLTGEPSCKGTSLTEWVTVYRASSKRFSSDPHVWMIRPDVPEYEPPEAKAAAEAVRAIYSQALPVLVKWMDFRPASWKTSLLDYAAALPSGLQKIVPMRWLNPEEGSERIELAFTGFVILGSNAAPAIPALTRIAEDPLAPGRLHAIRAPLALGPPAVPALTNLLAGAGPAGIRTELRAGLGRMGADAQAAIPVLIRDTASPDVVVAGQSAGILGMIGQQPERVVPVLIRALDDRRDFVRQCAAFALGKYGDAARPAVPKLQTLLTDTPPVQAVARQTLQSIAPEALTDAPPH